MKPKLTIFIYTTSCPAAFTALALLFTPAWAEHSSAQSAQLLYTGGYGGYRQSPKYSKAQIKQRSEHRKIDIENLWETSKRLHPGATTKLQIEKSYSEFESSLQTAADELKTTEALKSDWAAEMIALYTKPHHKWPAVSHSLDSALTARAMLIKLTSAQAIRELEQRLYRFAAPEDRSRYYQSPDWGERL
jgi:hypothetical protein